MNFFKNNKLFNFFSKNEIKIVITFFFLYFCIGAFIYKDYGFNVDEKFNRSNGFFWLNYLANFFNFNELSEIAINKYNLIQSNTLQTVNDIGIYSIIFDVPAALLEIFFNIESEIQAYQLRHFLTFFHFFITVIFFFLLVKNRFSNSFISILSILIFILTPRLFGDSFHNNKDIIFLTYYTVSIFFYFRFLDDYSYKNIIFLSFFSAVSTSFRIIGIFIPFSLILIFIINFFKKNNKLNFNKIIIHFIFYAIFLFMIWPFFWEHPLQSLLKYFEIIKNYGSPNVFFLGQYYPSNLVPYYYFIFWIALTTPILHLILFSFGFTSYLIRISKRFIKLDNFNNLNDIWKSKKESKDFLIFINLIVFLLFFSFFNVHGYNGWRLGYFIYIFLIYFGIYTIYLIFLKFSNKLKNIFLISLLCFFIFSGYRLSLYHPYQSFYFNLFVPTKIKNSVEIDFAGLSGIHFLNQILNQENNSNIIKIGVASWYPLWFMVDLLEEVNKTKIQILNLKNLKDADYIYSNRISDVDKTKYNKYFVPKTFKKKEIKIDDVIIYEIYTK